MVRVATWLAGLLAVANGLNAVHMLVEPAAWYESVPGVSAAGPYNAHFIADIGFAYLVSAAGFALAVWPGPWRAAFAMMAAAWPTLHALFHAKEWLGHGIPAGAALVTEIIGVFLLSALGIYVAWVFARWKSS